MMLSIRWRRRRVPRTMSDRTRLLMVDTRDQLHALGEGSSSCSSRRKRLNTRSQVSHTWPYRTVKGLANSTDSSSTASTTVMRFDEKRRWDLEICICMLMMLLVMMLLLVMLRVMQLQRGNEATTTLMRSMFDGVIVFIARSTSQHVLIHQQVPSIIIKYLQSSSRITNHQVPSITKYHPSISHGIKIDVAQRREPGVAIDSPPPPALRRCDTCSTMLVLAITTGSSYPARGTALATRRYASAPRCYDSSTRSRPMRRMHRICIRWQRRRASSCPTSAPWHRRMTCCCRTSVA